MAGDSKVQLVAVHTIVRKESKDAAEQRFAPGEVLIVPASEAERLLKKGAVKRADEPEEDEEEEDTKKSSAKSRGKKSAAKDEAEGEGGEDGAPQNPSIVS